MDVVFELGADYKFDSGSLFVANEVLMTGTSAFIYTSPYQSFIASHGTWCSDYGTTLSVAPATFTLDRSYVLYPSLQNDFIRLQDSNSAAVYE